MKNVELKYHIFWQKWDDPLTKLKNQISLQNRNNSIGCKDYGDENSEIPPQQQILMHALPMMATPMGIVPAPMSDISSFNFWIGHSNFKITDPVARLLDNAPGVESLDFLSQYRFRISIGQAFNEDAVKMSIYLLCLQYLTEYAQTKNDIGTQ